MFESRQKKAESTEVSYWISYTDILAALLIIILLITVYVVYRLENTRYTVVENIGTLNQAEKIRKEMLQRIQEKLKLSEIDVEIADNHSVLRIPHSELTFQTNNFRIPINMRKNLDKIGQTVLEELNSNNQSEYFETIFIEGHTDNRPSNLLKGNLGLSTFRAISVWEHWTDRVSDDYQNLRNKEGERLFSVSGYGETRPTQKIQRTAEQLRKNRRIDLRFTIHKPESFEYNQIIDLFDYDENSNSNEQ
ncbi:MAG: OmpA family protein [Flavobacteriaceae bacterium]|nr:OmpA family protein [Flavobacteriaceae bacterium]